MFGHTYFSSSLAHTSLPTYLFLPFPPSPHIHSLPLPTSTPSHSPSLPHTTRHPTYQKDGLPRLLPMVGLCTLLIRRRRRNGPTHAQVGHVTSCDGHVMCVMCMRHVFIHCLCWCVRKVLSYSSLSLLPSGKPSAMPPRPKAAQRQTSEPIQSEVSRVCRGWRAHVVGR